MCRGWDIEHGEENEGVEGASAIIREGGVNGKWVGRLENLRGGKRLGWSRFWFIGKWA